MVHEIGSGGGGGLARAAIEAALKRQSQGLQNMQNQATSLSGSETAGAEGGTSFKNLVEQGLQNVNSSVQDVEKLPVEVMKGEVDFHEVAARLKQSELSFNFALEVRNKFVDAYREIMRMNV